MGNVILKQDASETVRHGIFVCNMAYLIGKEMELPEETLKELAIAGLVHDVGKLQLEKMGTDDTLVIEQLRFVRMHSSLSYEILKNEGFSDFVLQSILHHHENYDGSGYPDNLKKEEIPLGARILRVSDVFIALTSDRAYRQGFDVETAVSMMCEENKNYDMKVFMAFLNVVNSIDVDTVVKNNSTLIKFDSSILDYFKVF